MVKNKHKDKLWIKPYEVKCAQHKKNWINSRDKYVSYLVSVTNITISMLHMSGVGICTFWDFDSKEIIYGTHHIWIIRSNISFKCIISYKLIFNIINFLETKLSPTSNKFLVSILTNRRSFFMSLLEEGIWFFIHLKMF